MTPQERWAAIQQTLSKAVVSTGIVDSPAAGGIESPDNSILSEEFLAEVLQVLIQLAQNDRAEQMMGDDNLKLIAHDLLMSLRGNMLVN